MQQKLTLRLDDKAISKGKRYAARNGTSLSQLVQNYLLLLDDDDSIIDMVPISKKLATLAGIGVGEATLTDYRSHTEQKYR
ncbi:MAG TPA: toxin-antitoxin system protein [Coriobacteriia bacterium]|nr:toxin-antitoxin system protein [Coriobacteriia bacterium]